jgi:V8-like Glu-specific endopeptidase
MSLSGEWFDCKVTRLLCGLYVPEASQAIVGGMSGSPVLRRDGTAIGVVSKSNGQDCECASLTDHLPGWLLRQRVMHL